MAACQVAGLSLLPACDQKGTSLHHCPHCFSLARRKSSQVGSPKTTAPRKTAASPQQLVHVLGSFASVVQSRPFHLFHLLVSPYCLVTAKGRRKPRNGSPGRAPLIIGCELETCLLARKLKWGGCFKPPWFLLFFLRGPPKKKCSFGGLDVRG